jgi:hypothetical protein
VVWPGERAQSVLHARAIALFPRPATICHLPPNQVGGRHMVALQGSIPPCVRARSGGTKHLPPSASQFTCHLLPPAL